MSRRRQRSRTRKTYSIAGLLVVCIFAIAGLSFGTTLQEKFVVSRASQLALGKEADMQCVPGKDYQCPCNTPKEKCKAKKLPGGKDCPCTDMTNGHPTPGKCQAVNICKGEAPKGDGKPPEMPKPPEPKPKEDKPKDQNQKPCNATSTPNVSGTLIDPGGTKVGPDGMPCTDTEQGRNANGVPQKISQDGVSTGSQLGGDGLAKFDGGGQGRPEDWAFRELERMEKEMGVNGNPENGGGSLGGSSGGGEGGERSPFGKVPSWNEDPNIGKLQPPAEPGGEGTPPPAEGEPENAPPENINKTFGKGETFGPPPPQSPTPKPWWEKWWEKVKGVF